MNILAKNKLCTHSLSTHISTMIGKYLVQVHEFMNVGQAERTSCRRGGRRRVGAAKEPAENGEEARKKLTW